MATIEKRQSVRWRVFFEEGGKRQMRSFDSKEAASEARVDLERRGAKVLKVESRDSTAYLVRIRSKWAPELCKTFSKKAEAVQWAATKEGEIAKRQFVDYREAEKHSLGDLLKRFEQHVLGGRPESDPARVRLRKLQTRSIALMPMATLKTSDLATYRDARHKGELGDPAIRACTVNKELDLIGTVIKLARKEWDIHLVDNVASAKLLTRLPKEKGEERDRRLNVSHIVAHPVSEMASGEASVAAAAASRDARRKSPDAAFENDPEGEALLNMDQSEQQALLRVMRYPHWFTQRKRVVTAATEAARAKRGKKSPQKARVRDPKRYWCLVSLAVETAMRRGELLKLKWAHINLKGGYLSLPAEITKNRQPRLVPLTLRALRIFSTQPRTGELVFDVNFEAYKSKFRRAREVIGSADLRVHDLRHESTSRLFEQTDLRANEIGAVTGHTSPKMLERYYNKRPAEFVERFKKSFQRVS